LVNVEFTYSAAPGPRTAALPRWLTSKRPTGGARRGVLSDGAFVRDRHQPAGELGEAGAELTMSFL
jgi:hypothetical protein